jgi:hypothetical protein
MEWKRLRLKTCWGLGERKIEEPTLRPSLRESDGSIDRSWRGRASVAGGGLATPTATTYTTRRGASSGTDRRFWRPSTGSTRRRSTGCRWPRCQRWSRASSRPASAPASPTPSPTSSSTVSSYCRRANDEGETKRRRRRRRRGALEGRR